MTTLKIRDVHTALATLVGGLSIEEPVVKAMRTVYPYVPPANQSIVPPTAIVMHDLTSCRFLSGGMVQQDYDMHIQVFIAKGAAILNVNADIANAFLDELVTALSNSVRLGGVVDLVRELRGSGEQRETLALLEWGGETYVGLDLVIPIQLTDTRPRAA